MWQAIPAILASPETWAFAAVGFFAQVFDGALGMGFGAISSAALAAAGVPREIASASVNGAKIFTGAASGLSHVMMRNVDGRMLVALAVAGILGGVAGATLLARSFSHWIGVGISLYLFAAGAFIVWRTTRAAPNHASWRAQGGVGFAGGLLEAISGVWGPLVTSNLVALGASPRHVVGTGNVAETFVAATVFGLLVSRVGFASLSGIALGLLGGALLAAPFAALLARRVAARPLTIGVGVLVMATSLLRLARDLGVH
ncbi:MAG: sulfite exporter TauE/SafE family protein [Gammaproteobacteria bacterium]|nr:sulfite exporter TauE/SafE family protein [Gammaproteobacteria bacterium]